MIRKISPWFDPNIIPKHLGIDEIERPFNIGEFYRFQREANIENVRYKSDGWRQHYYLLWKTKKDKNPWKVRYGSYDDGLIYMTWTYEPRSGCSMSYQRRFGWEEHKICNTVFVSNDESEIKKLSSMLNADKNRLRDEDDIFDEFMKKYQNND